MLQNLRQSEASLISVIREATAALNALGAGELTAALADLERAKTEAVARLKLAASITQLTAQHVADEADKLTEQLRAGLFGTQQAAQDATQTDDESQAEREQPAPASDAPERQSEPVVSVAANSPVETAEQVEATAQIVEAMQGQARDGSTREQMEAGLDALHLTHWHKRDLLSLARRLSRDTSGKPGKAELVRMVRACVLDVQALCGFQN